MAVKEVLASALGVESLTRVSVEPLPEVISVIEVPDTPLLDRLQRIEGQGENCNWIVVRARATGTSPVQIGTAFPTFDFAERKKFSVEWGVYAQKFAVNFYEALVGKILGDEFERKAAAAIRVLKRDVEKDILFGTHPATGEGGAFDGLITLANTAAEDLDMVVESAGSAALSLEVINKAAAAVKKNGGQPRVLLVGAREMARLETLQYAKLVVRPPEAERYGIRVLEVLTRAGPVEVLYHPDLDVATGASYAVLLDDRTETEFGPAIHIRFLGSAEPFRVDVAPAEGEIVRALAWVLALCVPGAPFQAVIKDIVE